ncbi:MAG: EAL domain-containing protein [Pseudomonadales bacterium]
MSRSRQKAFASRLSFIQARNCVVVAFIVGMLLSVVQIGVDYVRETDAVESFANEVLEASQYAAADAAYHLDGPAAQEVARGILQYGPVVSATVTNEEGMELAMLEKPYPPVRTGDIRYRFFGESKTFKAPLYLESGELIGHLTVMVDPVLAAQGFMDRSLLVVLSGVVRNILLSFILIFVFHHTITKKLVAISSRLADVDIKNPHEHRIPEGSFKKTGELRDLVRTVNRMLGIIASDIEERELREQTLLVNETELAYQANHDTLTGLVNRRGFERRLKAALQSSQSEKAEHVLCYLDLDQFKVINDTCGHIAGDELLRQISTVLAKGLRRHDVLARLGGDEFGILMEHCDLEHACQAAETMCGSVEAFRFEWEGRRFSVGVSIGVVAITEAETDTINLLKKADVACYAAKAAGRHCVRLYHAGEAEFAKLHGDMRWASKISEALEEDRFKLFAQPIVPVSGKPNQGFHYEVLLRMIDDEEGLVPPGAFLPAAEQYDMINKLDSWVIETLFRYLHENPQHLEQVWMCSINLSGPSLASSGFQDYIIDRLEHYNIAPGKICFEITETAAITNLAKATRFIEVLREKGCRFALDDFGTGLSSFAYLKNLQVDYLKIDGVFIRDIVSDPIDYAMAKSIHEIGRVTGMQTIAEFVENSATQAKLAEIGVDFAQGYGIGMPVEIESIDRFYCGNEDADGPLPQDSPDTLQLNSGF